MVEKIFRRPVAPYSQKRLFTSGGSPFMFFTFGVKLNCQVYVMEFLEEWAVGNGVRSKFAFLYTAPSSLNQGSTSVYSVKKKKNNISLHWPWSHPSELVLLSFISGVPDFKISNKPGMSKRASVQPVMRSWTFLQQLLWDIILNE